MLAKIRCANAFSKTDGIESLDGAVEDFALSIMQDVERLCEARS